MEGQYPLGLLVAETEVGPAPVALPDERRREEVGSLRTAEPGPGPTVRRSSLRSPYHVQYRPPRLLVFALLERMTGEQSTGRPSITPICGTSSCPKPAGPASGGPSSQFRRSGRGVGEHPVASAAVRRARAATSMCQPSPSGSANTNGSRQVSLRRRPGERLVPARVGDAAPGSSPTVSPRHRSSDSATPIRWSQHAVSAVERRVVHPPDAVVAPRHRPGPHRQVVPAGPGGASASRGPSQSRRSRRGRVPDACGQCRRPGRPARGAPAGRTGGTARRRRRPSCPRSSGQAGGASDLARRGRGSAAR